MSSVVNTVSRLGEEQMAVIRRGAVGKKDIRQVHEEVCAVRPATQKVVREAMEKVAGEMNARSDAKREGARLVRGFLKMAKEGADIDDMAAALEQAVYRDILRRYAEAGDPLVSMTMEQLLRLDLSYRSARLSKRKEEGREAAPSKLVARVCVETFEKIVELSGGHGGKGLRELKGKVLGWAKARYGEENVLEIENEEKEIERLSRLFKRSRGAGKGKAGPRKAFGLAS